LAQKLADEWEQLEKLAGQGRLTKTQCRKVIAQMYERTVGEPLHFKSTREYLVEWVESKKNETELRAFWKYRQIVDDFLAHLGSKADRLLREIAPADIRSWRDALKRKGLAAPTVNHAIKILRMPFRAAHDAGYIDINPCTKNSVRPVKDDSRNVEKDVFTPEQLVALIGAAKNNDWRGAILCGAYTGLRLRDIADLQWGAINWEQQKIAVTTRKTRQDVIVPIHPEFASWLQKQTRGIGKAPVFPGLAEKLGAEKSGLSMQFKRLRVPPPFCYDSWNRESYNSTNLSSSSIAWASFLTPRQSTSIISTPRGDKASSRSKTSSPSNRGPNGSRSRCVMR
jgi:integrase